MRHMPPEEITRPKCGPVQVLARTLPRPRLTVMSVAAATTAVVAATTSTTAVVAAATTTAEVTAAGESRASATSAASTASAEVTATGKGLASAETLPSAAEGLTTAAKAADSAADGWTLGKVLLWCSTAASAEALPESAATKGLSAMESTTALSLHLGRSASKITATELATTLNLRRSTPLSACEIPAAEIPAAAGEVTTTGVSAPSGEVATTEVSAPAGEVATAIISAPVGAAAVTAGVDGRTTPAHVAAAAPVDMSGTRPAPFIVMPAAVQPEHSVATEVAIVDRAVIPAAADINWLVPDLVIAEIGRIAPGRIVVIVIRARGVRVRRVRVDIAVCGRRCRIRRVVIVVGRRPVIGLRRGRRSIGIRAIIATGVGIADRHARGETLRVCRCGHYRGRPGQCDCRDSGLGHQSHFRFLFCPSIGCNVPWPA